MRPADFALWAGATVTFPALLYGYGSPPSSQHAVDHTKVSYDVYRDGRSDKITAKGPHTCIEALYLPRLHGRISVGLSEIKLEILGMDRKCAQYAKFVQTHLLNTACGCSQSRIANRKRTWRSYRRLPNRASQYMDHQICPNSCKEQHPGILYGRN